MSRLLIRRCSIFREIHHLYGPLVDRNRVHFWPRNFQNYSERSIFVLLTLKQHLCHIHHTFFTSLRYVVVLSKWCKKRTVLFILVHFWTWMSFDAMDRFWKNLTRNKDLGVTCQMPLVLFMQLGVTNGYLLVTLSVTKPRIFRLTLQLSKCSQFFWKIFLLLCIFTSLLCGCVPNSLLYE